MATCSMCMRSSPGIVLLFFIAVGKVELCRCDQSHIVFGSSCVRIRIVSGLAARTFLTLGEKVTMSSSRL